MRVPDEHKRKAAGLALLLFARQTDSVACALANHISRKAQPDSLSDGLTDSEVEVVERITSQIFKLGTMMTFLGHKLLRNPEFAQRIHKSRK